MKRLIVIASIVLLMTAMALMVVQSDIAQAYMQGHVGIDTPWEDFFPSPVSDIVYWVMDVIKDIRDGFTIGGFTLFEDGSYWLRSSDTVMASGCMVKAMGCS